jgi:hypothetical protein
MRGLITPQEACNQMLFVVGLVTMQRTHKVIMPVSIKHLLIEWDEVHFNQFGGFTTKILILI